MTNPNWTAQARDEVYTQLCEAVTQNAAAVTSSSEETSTELFLSRLCLLLIEELADLEAARRALSGARLQVAEDATRSVP